MSKLPLREPLRCRLLLHKWSGWVLRPVHHLGELGFEDWQHVCLGKVRICHDCGSVKRSWTKRSCATGWVVRLPDMPHRMTSEEWKAASRVLMER